MGCVVRSMRLFAGSPTTADNGTFATRVGVEEQCGQRGGTCTSAVGVRVGVTVLLRG